MTASGNQRCIALPFAMSLSSLSNGCVLILPLQFLHCASPLMTPSSPNRPNTKPWPLQGRCCYPSNSGASGWSSVARPPPEPGRRHMIWETRMKHTAHIIPQTCENLTIVLLIKKFRFRPGRLTLPGQLTAWLKNWPHYMQLLQGTFLGNPWTWFLMILNMSGRTNY